MQAAIFRGLRFILGESQDIYPKMVVFLIHS